MSIGRRIDRSRWPILLAWLAVTLLLLMTVPWPDPTIGEATDLLPADTPVHHTLDKIAHHFGKKAGLSEAVIVFERKDAPLSAADMAYIQTIAAKIPDPPGPAAAWPELQDIAVLAPQSFAFLGQNNPLVSADKNAALITVDLPYNFITRNAIRMVGHLQAVLQSHPAPAGLAAAVTGSSSYGHDYALALERSHHKTLGITLLVVVVILLVVYRAPIAAIIPLIAIGMAAIVTVKILVLLEPLGLHSGTAERIFVLVLLYGAGVDYSLLFMSRYCESLDAGEPHGNSVARGLTNSFIAITSSALMTIAGLAMLCFAHFGVFKNVGPAVILALIMAAIASATLVPAAVSIIGPVTFWPGRRRPSVSRPNPSPALPAGTRRFWPALANLVVRRPGLVFALSLLALALPAFRGSHIDWDYNSMASLAPSYDSVRGADMVTRHWPIGETAPLTILIAAQSPQPRAAWHALYSALVEDLRSLPTVGNIRGISTPLGTRATPAENLAVSLLAGKQIDEQFLSPDKRAMRLSVIFQTPPLVNAAMNDVAVIERIARSACEKARLPAAVHLAGATAEMVDIRTITQRDFRLVASLSLVAILLLIVLLFRDIPLALFMIAATVLSYFTTLGLTVWIFESLGHEGLEWKVQVFVFIVLIAVGQDYNIFFAVRFAQESSAPANPSLAAAMHRAIVHTGPVISSCGVIMAASLGSVMASDVVLLVQLGFAFALGMLIDTFVVRPLLLPAFMLLTRRSLRNASRFVTSAH